MEGDRASHTAVLVCQGRAAVDGRLAVGRFSDGTAMTLLRDPERPVVRRVRDGSPPRDWRDRMEFELVRATGEVLVPRTVAIDDAIRSRPASQLVIVGAGLDARAWRMPELAGVQVFEVDHPASQADKRERVAELEPLAGSVTYVPVDFTRDRLGDALAAAGHREAVPTTWVWEGVVPYLSRADVAATVRSLAARSAPGSRLIVNYQSPALVAVVGRLAARAMATLTGHRNPWAGEPTRSAWRPDDMARLLAGHGFVVNGDEDLLTIAGRLPMPVHQRQSLRSGRVAVADR